MATLRCFFRFSFETYKYDFQFFLKRGSWCSGAKKFHSYICHIVTIDDIYVIFYFDVMFQFECRCYVSNLDLKHRDMLDMSIKYVQTFSLVFFKNILGANRNWVPVVHQYVGCTGYVLFFLGKYTCQTTNTRKIFVHMQRQVTCLNVTFYVSCKT